MRVTQIAEFSRTHSKIYLDGEFAFVLCKGELASCHVREGQELPREDYDRIFAEVLPKRGKLYAMRLLQSRAYTEWEMRGKLERSHYPAVVIEEILDYAKSYRYIDDLRYALHYVTCHEEDRSRLQIERHLARRGISGEILEAAWRKWADGGGIRDEQAMIEKLLEKRHYMPETADGKEKQRIYAFLVRKGFSGEAVRKGMRIYE